MAQLVDKAKEFMADKIAHVKKPEASLDDMSMKHVSKDSITLLGQLSINNPYDHSLPICEISYSLKSAGREIVSGTMQDPGSIAAKDTTRLEIPLKVPYNFLVSLMRDAGRVWDIDYGLRVGLTVDLPILGKFTIPLSKEGEMKLPTLSNVF